MASSENEFGKELASVLGLDPNMMTSLTIAVDPQRTLVHVTYLTTDEQREDIISLFETYEVVAKEATRSNLMRLADEASARNQRIISETARQMREFGEAASNAAEKNREWAKQMNRVIEEVMGWEE